jgi:hypothetical protein
MARSLVDRQIARARRRLFFTSLLTLLAWSWLAAVLAAACWVLVQPRVAPAALALRWHVAAGLAGVASALAVALAVRRAPSPVAAALALDERFGLKERVTTSRTLAPDEAATPAGKALLADVESRLAGVRVGERFRVGVPRLPAMLLPVSLAGLVLLALFWNPDTGSAGSPEDDARAVAPAAKEDVEDRMKLLAARPKAKKEDGPGAEELRRINEEIEKFTRAPRETREEVRDRIKDSTAIEEQIRREQREQARRVEAFQEAMKQVQRLKRKERERQNGPGDRASDAVARGDMDAARDELERLSRRLEKEEEKERLRRKKSDPKASEEEKKEADEQLKAFDREDDLTQKERERLARQLEEMEDDLKRLTRRKDEKEKELREMAERGEIDKDALDRELGQLERMDELTEQEKKEVEELANDLRECKQCLREGDRGKAAEKLAKAAGKCGNCGKEGEGQALARRLAQIRQVKRSLCRSLEGGVGAGRRPDAKDDATGHKDALVPGEWDKGKVEVVGQGPAGGFKGPRKPAELQEEIRQAAQEAPAAIDRQRLPASARKMARGYFEKVRGADKDGKKK